MGLTIKRKTAEKDNNYELDIYKDYLGIQNNLEKIKQVLSMEEVLFLQEEAENVFIHDEIITSVRNIVRDTRSHPEIFLGASTRSGITFLKCLKAYALVNGRTYVTEDDLRITSAVMDHRLIYRSKEAKQKALGTILVKEMDRLRKLNIVSSRNAI